jgi:hypothetical protein
MWLKKGCFATDDREKEGYGLGFERSNSNQYPCKRQFCEMQMVKQFRSIGGRTVNKRKKNAPKINKNQRMGCMENEVVGNWSHVV